MNFLRTMFTDANNDWCVIRTSGAIAVLTICAVFLRQGWTGHAVNFQDFGVATAAILAGIGAGVYGKAKDRPT